MIPHSSISLLLILAPVTIACSSRAVPSDPPATSPLSSRAEEAPRASLTTALERDPPLPGESTDEWHGLRTSESPGGASAEPPAHGEHHRHDSDPGAAAPAGSHEGHEHPSPSTNAHEHTEKERQPKTAPPEKARKEPRKPPAAVYSCPMHPEVVSGGEGRCPKCGMNLVKQQ